MSTTLRAALWMIGSIVAFTAMAVAGREVSRQLDTFEVMLYRSGIGLAIVVALLSVTGKWSAVSIARLPAQVLRNLLHFTGQNLWFFAISVAPLAQVFALEFTSPLWVIVLSPLLLAERMTRLRAVCALAGFIGILIVARPSAETMSPGLIAAAAAAVFFAMTTITTKRLTRTESIGSIMFWLTLIQLILGIIAAGHDGDIALPDRAALPYVLVIAIGGLLAHYCLTNALAIAPAAIVVPFDFARLPTIAIIGALLYGEQPDIWVLVGAAIIFGANYVNVLGETRRNRVAATGVVG